MNLTHLAISPPLKESREFKIGEGAKISCNGVTIVTGPKEGKLSDYNAKCR